VGSFSQSGPTTAKRLRLGVVTVTGLATMLIGFGCGSGPSPPPNAVAITPMCTILCDAQDVGSPSPSSVLFVADRTDPGAASNFTALRSASGPTANLAIGTPTADRGPYAASEAWQRFPGSPVVWRALATPAPLNRTAPGSFDFRGSSWQINLQTDTTTPRADGWSGILGTGSANSGREIDGPEQAAFALPQLMAVGVSEPQVFACAGGRTQKNDGRTTWLLEAIPPNVGRGDGRVSFIQDLLYGDDKFTPTSGDVLAPPVTSPPQPTVRGPGDPSGGWGAVKCGMTQVEDDLATRELHMIAVTNGRLFHAMASDWGPATFGGSSFNRFGNISRWDDVSQTLGVNFGTITEAAIVARPSAISVFFLAESGGRTRLWHTVRFSDGSWRPAQDVWALSGDAPTGTAFSFGGVAAANCPAYAAGVWDASSTETLVAIWEPNQVHVIRVVPTARQWQTGATGIYAPWETIPLLTGFRVHSVAVTARPFRDDLMPVP
jgi:hypothetical protein